MSASAKQPMRKQATEQLGTFGPERPDLVVHYLRYALEDVKQLSLRSAMLLEEAIDELEQEIKTVVVEDELPPDRPLS
jgi:hypothetical protein